MTMEVDFTYFLTYWRVCAMLFKKKIPRYLSKVFGFTFLTKEGGN